VFQWKLLRKIYGPCKDIITGEWRTQKNRKLLELYQNPSIIEDITKKDSNGQDMHGVKKNHF